MNSSNNVNQSASSNVQQQRSDATGLRRNLHGVIYQVKLLILFLQTAIDNKYEFQLHSEKDDADKFDDVIFQCGKDGQYRFLQAKHKSNPENKITIDELRSDNVNRPFNLKKYFNSLCKIEQQPQYKGKIKDLVLCTNTDFKEDIKKERLILDEKHDDILNIGGGKRYKLRLDKNEDIIEVLKKFYHDKIRDKEQHGTEEEQSSDSIIDNEIQRFFEKLVFAVKQPDEEKLGKLIQERILNCLDDLKDDVQTELIYDFVEKKILNWLKRPDGIALSNKNDFFKEGREKIREIMFHVPHLEYSSFIKELNINFISECKEIRELNGFLKCKNNILNLVSLEKNFSISQIKIHQIRQQPGWHLKGLLNLKKYDNNKVKGLFNNDLLIIICKDEFQLKCEDIKDLYQELINIVKEDGNKKIILISQNNNILANFFKEGDLKNNYMEISDEIRFEDLCPNYLQKQLFEKTIIFQGEKTKLSRLINIDNKKLNNSNLGEEEIRKIKSVIKPEVLSELLLNTDIIVGNKLPDFNDPSSPYYDAYYIDVNHTYSYQTIEKNSLQKCIKEKKEDLFVFPYTIRDYITENILIFVEESEIKYFTEINSIFDKRFFEGRFFILSNENSEREFFELSNNCKGKNIHWLQCIGNDRLTVKYSNYLPNLRKFIRMEYLEKEIRNNSIVIIIGAAGVGKSTVLSTYSQKLNPFSWAIRINLKDHQDNIKIANLENFEGIMEFFYQTELEGLETALAKSLLGYYLAEYKERVTLLLDGYDEITEYNQNIINHLLRFFKNTERKIWLTTRLSEQYKIEDTLETFAFSYFLNPLNEKQQEDFLKQYWIKKLEESDQEGKNCINKFTKELLKHFHNLGLMKEDSLIGIILQARMVAEIFHPKSEFSFSEVEISDITDLYERFIERQYSRYFKQKIKIDINLLGRGSRNTLTDSYTKAHGYLALNTLYSSLNVRSKGFEDQYFLRHQVSQIHRKFLPCELNGVGIIKSFNDGNYIADFIHRTYAEYFTAMLSVKLLNKDVEHHKFKLIFNFLLQILSLDRNKLIRIFLEHEIKKKNNANAKCHWKSIQQLLGETKTKSELFSNLSESDKTTIKNEHYTMTNKTLSELKKDIESSMDINSRKSYLGCEMYAIYKYNFNGDIDLLNHFFQTFLHETNVEELRTALDFIIEIYSISNHPYLDLEFTRHKYNAIQHYLTQANLQNKYNPEYTEKIFVLIDGKNSIKKFLDMLNKIKEIRNSLDEIQKEKHLRHLINLLISKHKRFTEDFRRLNNIVYYLFETFDQHLIEDINSIENIQKYYKNKILIFLETTKHQVVEDNFGINMNDMCMAYLQSFFINITHHSNIIADTKVSINEMFICQRSNIRWLERTGILISRFLKILTLEMSDVFISFVKDSASLSAGDKQFYIYRIFYNVIIYFLDLLRSEELPQIDKSALLKIIIYFGNFFVTSTIQFLPFKPSHLEITLKLLKNELNQLDTDNWIIREKITLAVDCMYMLNKVGLDIIQLADKKILIRDPQKKFQFEVSSDYNNEIINIIITNNKNTIRKHGEIITS